MFRFGLFVWNRRLGGGSSPVNSTHGDRAECWLCSSLHLSLGLMTSALNDHASKAPNKPNRRLCVLALVVYGACWCSELLDSLQLLADVWQQQQQQQQHQGININQLWKHKWMQMWNSRTHVLSVRLFRFTMQTLTQDNTILLVFSYVIGLWVHLSVLHCTPDTCVATNHAVCSIYNLSCILCRIYLKSTT